ncbi:MAG: ABC transporter substrate-binding protein [Pseudomonadota bacterium]
MRTFRLALRFAAAVLALAALPLAPAAAATLRMANQGDALSMDPHSLQESFQLGFLANIYEPLVARGRKFELEPALATAWRATAPTVWRFELRRGVRFHDGSPFSADDVIFSFERTRAESSDTKLYVAPIKEIRKVDAHTIDVVTSTPYPILPELLTGWLVMSKSWSEKNNAAVPQDVRKGKENFATTGANGTGPFMLKTRQPNVRTTLVPFSGWWAKPEHNLTEVVFTPISNDATRLAALVSGEVDMMEPAPLQDLDRLRAHPQLKVLQAPELRTMFLGLDVARDELLYSGVKGRNPLKERRVRQALHQAIDIEAIRQKIMRGAAQPAGILLAPGVNGYEAALDKRPPFDAAAARQLLAEAGYPSGFELGMHCPNDRYVNDAEICQAVAAMWSRIGIKANLVLETKSLYLPRALKRDVSVFLLGWQPASNDAHNTLWALLNTPAPDGQGRFNLGGYSNPKVDELTRRIGVEVDAAKRQALMREAWKTVADELPVLPLHNQALAWGVRRNVELVQHPDNNNPLRFAVVR